MPIATRRPVPPSSGRPTAKPQAAPARPAAARPTAPRPRAFVLDIPFEMRGMAQVHGAPWDAKAKAFVYRGEELPAALRPFRSQPYSWERFQEDELNNRAPVASKPEKEVTLRPHQKDCVKAVLSAEKAGRSCFLIADDVGLGKTIETWVAALAMRDTESVLIVCPLAVVANWRRTIQWLGDGGKRIVVINYDRLKKLFDVPPTLASKTAARRKTKVRKVRTQKGIAKFGEAQEFDLIIWDESHKLRNLESARSKLSMRLNAEAEFIMWLSATAGQNPLELAYLAPLLAESTGAKAKDLADYDAWCQDQGIGVVKGAYGKRVWRGMSKEPKEREGADEDLKRFNQLLFSGRVPGGIRRAPTDIAGWPEINRILLPVDLEGEDRRLYEQAWGEFRHQLELEAKGTADPKNALVVRLRFRQKASLLRTSATVDLALELLEQGQQVAISCAFMESLEVVRDALAKEGYGVAEIHGRMTGPQKEEQRLAFQRGEKTVCVYTVEEGISLHQGEYNNAKRSNIIHDLRWSAIAMKQVEGRTHRDGKFSQVYWMLGAGTVEEGIAEVVATRIRSMSVMQGDQATVTEIEKLLSRMSKVN